MNGEFKWNFIKKYKFNKEFLLNEYQTRWIIQLEIIECHGRFFRKSQVEKGLLWIENIPLFDLIWEIL